MNHATVYIFNFVFVLSVLFRLSCDTNPPFQSISRVEKLKKSFLMLRNIHRLLYSFWCLECWKWHFRASRFKNFLGGHAPRTPQKPGPYGPLIVTAAYYSTTIRLLQILLKTLTCAKKRSPFTVECKWQQIKTEQLVLDNARAEILTLLAAD